mmetsp:Transcript_11540/g.30849  ORF Transcript_11540/g.30849 Transcript_11540/m.30849 type:complete len:219 (-) Transcript_11540:312-968(-)
MIGSSGGCDACLGGWARWLRDAKADGKDGITQDMAIVNAQRWDVGASSVTSERQQQGETLRGASAKNDAPVDLPLGWPLQLAPEASDLKGDATVALHEAVRNDDFLRTVGALDAGADASASSGDGGYTALHAAARTGNMLVTQLLLGRGAKLEARTADGKTPLAVAVDEGCWNAVQLLVDARADVNAQVGGAGSILAIAKAAGRRHFVEFLSSHGAVG